MLLLSPPGHAWICGPRQGSEFGAEPIGEGAEGQGVQGIVQVIDFASVCPTYCSACVIVALPAHVIAPPLRTGWGSRRSLGGRPEPRWPPAFALRGPMKCFSARAEAPSPTGSASVAQRVYGHPGRGLHHRRNDDRPQVPGPLDPQAIGPRRAAGSGPPGSEVSRPSNIRFGSQIVGSLHDYPLRSAPPHVRVLGPGRLPQRRDGEKYTPGLRGACDKDLNQSRALNSLGSWVDPLMGTDSLGEGRQAAILRHA
ncbi:hypothetical protein KKHFBJBL_01959 [Brevundimonas sp. NIBR11]|nr:hypothetical protein KKHFBJBL_01959 [Brevundimonas sp. NIBR11]